MKLIRFGEPGMERCGVAVSDDRFIDVSQKFNAYDEQFFQSDGLKELGLWLEDNQDSAPAIPSTERLGAPINRPSKIICIGLNYSDHAEEAGMPVPKEPILFFKSTTSMCGPYDDLVIPKNSHKTDWEVELAIVIGKKAQYVSQSDVLEYVAGYMVMNDYSEREWQLEREGQWVKGKSADTFSPCGPYLVTKDEIPDPHNLSLWLTINGKKVQNGSTQTLIFGVQDVVSYTSQFMTLLPGDIISTGTPPGVGMGMKPPRFVQPGDVIELGIERLGSSKQVAKAYSS